MRKLLDEPNPLDVLATVVGNSGAWRDWTFERQVWFLRKQAGVTQIELSRRSGVSQNRISRIEAGEDLKLSTLRALWRPLGFSPLVMPDVLDRRLEPVRKRGGTK